MDKKIDEIVFLLCDKCICIACVKLSLLTRESLSSTVNVLTNTLKILNITNTVFSNSIAFAVIKNYGKAAVV